MKRTLAAAITLALATTAAAEPYQYDLRSRFTRELRMEDLKEGFYLQPRIESALMFVGNINLAEDSADEIDTAGIELAPGIYTSYLSPRAQAFLDYSLIGRVFEESDYDGVSHLLDARGTYDVVPEWFRVHGSASYRDTVIDPTRSYNYGGSGLFADTNLSETLTASVTPDFSHDFGDFRVDARYTYGRTWFLDQPDTGDAIIFSQYQDDSIDQLLDVSVGTRRENRALSARVFYEWQNSDFERTVDYQYERAGAEAGWRLTRTISFVADGGMETDLDESTVEGGLDEVFWHAGFEWRPDERTLLDARYGERFFGNSWRASLRRETKYVTLRASYIEDPDIETRRVGLNLDPDEIPVPNPGFDLSGFTSFPYVRKDADFSVLAEGARTKLRFDVYNHQREYINDFPPDEERKGGRFNALRDLGAHLYAEFDARYEDVFAGGRTLGQTNPFLYQYYDWSAIGRLSWEVYTNFLASAEAGYLKRTGDTNYDGEWLAFRVRYTF
jgi:hypothetical protein